MNRVHGNLNNLYVLPDSRAPNRQSQSGFRDQSHITKLRSFFGKYLELYRCIVSILLLNVPIIALILLRDLRHVDWSVLTCFYVTCVIVSWYTLPVLVVASLLSMILFPFRKVAIVGNAAALSIYVYYLLLDNLVYDIYKFHINFFWLEFLFKDFRGLGISKSLVITAIAALLGIIVIETGIFFLARRIKKNKCLLIFPLFAIAALAASQVIHIFAYDKNDNRITNITVHLPFYVPSTSHKHAVKYGDMIPLGQLEPAVASAQHQAGSLNYPLRDIHYDAPLDGKLPNIVFILLESWRYDMMNETVSPNIHSISLKSSVFLNHFSSGNQTTCGIFGLFYGLHPTYWTAVKANSIQIDNPLFIDILKDYQYTFGIYAESHFKRHKIKDTIFRGIEVHNSFSGRTFDKKDEDMTNQVISFLGKQQSSVRPFMALAFFKSTHFNYCYDQAHARFLPSRKMNMALVSTVKDPELHLNDYRNAVCYVDDLVGRIIDELESLGMMDNTIIIITTDHGEEFDDNNANYWGHGSNFTQYQTKVPLIIYCPDKEPLRITSNTSHIDIPPTIIQEYLGCMNDISDYSDGINLFTGLRDEHPLVISSYFNHAFIIEDNVYAIYPLYTKKYKLDDIRGEASRPPMDILRMLMNDITRFYIFDSTVE